MGKMKKEINKELLEYMEQFRGKRFLAIINRVSKSGMSRRIEFYAPDSAGVICRIGADVAKLLRYTYNIDQGGMLVKGCGMDMIFSVLSQLNYKMAELDTGKTLQELLKTKECGERIYDNYFTDANNYLR